MVIIRLDGRENHSVYFGLLISLVRREFQLTGGNLKRGKKNGERFSQTLASALSIFFNLIRAFWGCLWIEGGGKRVFTEIKREMARERKK